MLVCMGKVIYYVASSLDGYIATEDHNLDWLLTFGFEAFQRHFDQFRGGIGSLVMGSATYEWVRRQEPDSWEYGALPCRVLTSRTLQAPPDSGVRFVSGDIGQICTDALEDAAGRNVWLVGGGTAGHLHAGCAGRRAAAAARLHPHGTDAADGHDVVQRRRRGASLRCCVRRPA